MERKRAPCCERMEVKKGWWTGEEDSKLVSYIQKHGHQNWRTLPKRAGLLRCGKSCRLRWVNYLRPGIKHGNFTQEEEETIVQLHRTIGNQWSKIASFLPGRTDNEIKNIWNTYLRKRAMSRSSNSMLKSGAGTSNMIEAQTHCVISSNTLPANPFKLATATEQKDLAVPFEAGKDPTVFGECERWLVELAEELGLFGEVEFEENWEKMVTEGGGDPVAAFIGNIL